MHKHSCSCQQDGHTVADPGCLQHAGCGQSCSLRLQQSADAHVPERQSDKRQFVIHVLHMLMHECACRCIRHRAPNTCCTRLGNASMSSCKAFSQPSGARYAGVPCPPSPVPSPPGLAPTDVCCIHKLTVTKAPTALPHLLDAPHNNCLKAWHALSNLHPLESIELVRLMDARYAKGGAWVEQHVLAVGQEALCVMCRGLCCVLCVCVGGGWQGEEQD